MKKIKIVFTLIITLILLNSCKEIDTENKNNKIGSGKTETKKDLSIQEKIKQSEIERLAKFDKKYTRKKEKTLTGYLCYEELLTHPGTKINLITKNCKQEYGNGFVYFRIKGNSFYKLNNKVEKRIIKIIPKKETDSIIMAISSDIISNFANILDVKNCKSMMLVKKDIFKDDENKQIFSIEPIGFYKNETEKQLKISKNTEVCEGYYPNNKKFVLYNLEHENFFLEVAKDDLINIEKINYPKKIN